METDYTFATIDFEFVIKRLQLRKKAGDGLLCPVCNNKRPEVELCSECFGFGLKLDTFEFWVLLKGSYNPGKDIRI